MATKLLINTTKYQLWRKGTSCSKLLTQQDPFALFLIQIKTAHFMYVIRCGTTKQDYMLRQKQPVIQTRR